MDGWWLMPFDEGTGVRPKPYFRGKPPPTHIDDVCRILRQNRIRLNKRLNKRRTVIRTLDRVNLEAGTPQGAEGELVHDADQTFWIYMNGQWQPRNCG